ncbi:hypothetical protein NKG05_03205 [Oerskovia sp. M15]
MTFTTQPVAAVSVESGKNLTISSTAVSTSTATPRRASPTGGRALRQGPRWTDVAGATSKNLLLKKVSTTTDQHRYRVVATAGKSSVTSAVSTVTVTKAPTTLKLAASTLRTGPSPRHGQRLAGRDGRGHGGLRALRHDHERHGAPGVTTTITLPQSLPFGTSGTSVQVNATFTPADTVEFTGTTAELTTKVG